MRVAARVLPAVKGGAFGDGGSRNGSPQSVKIPSRVQQCLLVITSMPAHPPPPHPSPSSCMAVCLLSQNDYVSATFSSSLGPCSYFFDLSQICFPFLSCLPLPNYALGISPSICICIFSDLFPSFQVSASQTCPWSILVTEWVGNRSLKSTLGHHGTKWYQVVRPLVTCVHFLFLLTFYVGC